MKKIFFSCLIFGCMLAAGFMDANAMSGKLATLKESLQNLKGKLVMLKNSLGELKSKLSSGKLSEGGGIAELQAILELIKAGDPRKEVTHLISQLQNKIFGLNKSEWKAAVREIILKINDQEISLVSLTEAIITHWIPRLIDDNSM